MTPTESNTHNENGYNIWSAFYDEYPNPTVAVDDANFPAWWNHLESRKIFELGCGTGRHTIRLAEKNNSLTSIDASEGMIRRAREKVRSLNVQFMRADFLSDMDFGGDYDAMIESLVLEHISALDRYFGKAARLLRRGGELFMSEIHPSRIEHGVKAHFRFPGGNDEFHFDSYYHPAERIIRVADENRFELVRQKDILGDDSLRLMNPKWSRYAGIPMIQMWHFERR